MSFPIYFVKGKEKNNSKCRQLTWHIIMAWEPPLQCRHRTSGSSWQHQQALKLGEKSHLCQLRFLISCQKGRFCAVRTRSVSGCWPLARLWSPRLEGCDAVLAAAGVLPVLSQAKQTENSDFWSFENPGRRDQTDSPNFFLITVSVFYWHMLRKYETISGGDIDFVLRYQLIFLSLIKVYNITLSFVQQRFFDTIKKWVSQNLGYLLLLMSTDKITLFWIKLYSGSYHVTNNCY